MNKDQRIQVVILMAKLESPTLVIRKLQAEKWVDVPHRNTIVNLYNKFKKTGSVLDADRSGRPSIDDETKEKIKNHVHENPQSSIRQTAKLADTSYSSVQKVLKNELNFFPYKIQLTQELHPEDCALRVNMAQILIEKINFDTNFLHNIIFSDESTFRLDGTVNRHNCRIWAKEKPSVTFQKSHSSKRIHGPFFFDGNITGQNYLEMLQQCFIPQLTRQELRKAVFQQDGAPPHFAMPVRAFLDTQFPERWLGRAGPMVWAARSPDLSPLDFFLWGHLKNKVYETRPTTIQELKDKICDEAEKITEEMCNKAILCFRKRLQYCVDCDGQNVENK